jgi:hypothetical protein
VSFIIASIFAHYWDNVLLRGFYFAAATWLGALTYFFLTFLLVWIILWISISFNVHFSKNVLGYGAILLTVFLTCYGLWNANNPQVTDVDVTLKNLPEAWK